MMNWKKRKRAVSAIAFALAFMCMAQEMLCTVRAEAAELPAEEIVSSIAKQGDAASDAAEGILGMLGEQAGGEDDGIGIMEGLRLGETNASLRASKSEQAGKKKLKNYILKHGKKMADGNKGITIKDSNGDVACKGVIEYSSSGKTFIFSAKTKIIGSNYNYNGSMEMRMPLNNTSKTIKAKNQGRMVSPDISEYSSTGIVKVANYQDETSIDFKMTKFKFDGEKMNVSDVPANLKYSVAFLDARNFSMDMLIWDLLLMKKVKISMKEIGFRSFVH